MKARPKLIYARNGQFLVSENGEAIQVYDAHVNTHTARHPACAGAYIVKQDMGFSLPENSPDFKRVEEASHDAGLRDYGIMIASFRSSFEDTQFYAQVIDFLEQVFMPTEDFAFAPLDKPEPEELSNRRPKFRVTGKGRPDAKVFLQCSKCSADIREIKPHESINVTRAYFCAGCDNGAIHLNPPTNSDEDYNGN